MKRCISLLFACGWFLSSFGMVKDSVVHETQALTEHSSGFFGTTEFRLYREVHYFLADSAPLHSVVVRSVQKSSYMLQQSPDNGASWQPVFEFNAERIKNDLAQETKPANDGMRKAVPFIRFFNDLAGILYLDLSAYGKAGAFYHTEDGGKSWTLSQTGNSEFPLQFFTEQNLNPVHCINDSAALIVYSLGWKFTPLHSSSISRPDLSLQFLRTTDRGKTWTPGTEVTLPANYGAYKCEFSSPGHIRCSVAKLDYSAQSTDGGLSWQYTGTIPKENILARSYYWNNVFKGPDSLVLHQNHTFEWFSSEDHRTGLKRASTGTWRLDEVNARVVLIPRGQARNEESYALLYHNGEITLR